MENEAELRAENEKMRGILRDTLDMVRRWNADETLEPQTRGHMASLLGMQLCEVPALLGEGGGFTRHSGGPGVVGTATFNTAP